LPIRSSKTADKKAQRFAFISHCSSSQSPEEDKMLRSAVVLLAASCYLPACLAAASLFPVKLQFPAGQHPQLRAVEQCRKYWNKK